MNVKSAQNESAAKLKEVCAAAELDIDISKANTKLDEDGELHCTDGPAIWGKLYALHGLVLEEQYEWIVKNHETLTREKIDGIENQELRSIVIVSYPEKYEGR